MVEAGGRGASRLVSVRRNIMSMVCVKYKLEDIFLGRFCWYTSILCIDTGYTS